MPLPNLLRSAAGTCPYCNQKAGILSRDHPDCRRKYDASFPEMVTLTAKATRIHALDILDGRTLRLTIVDIAKRSHGDGETVNQALAELMHFAVRERVISETSLVKQPITYNKRDVVPGTTLVQYDHYPVCRISNLPSQPCHFVHRSAEA